jgi:hypothetical protein
MMLNRKKLLFLSVFFAGGLAAISLTSWGNFLEFSKIKGDKPLIALAQTPLVKKPEIPQSIMSCLPQQKSVKSLDLRAITDFQEKRYYLINVTEEVGSIFENETDTLTRNTVIQKDRLGCLVLIPREISMKNSMTLYLPLNVANSLALEALRKDVQDAGGKEKYLLMLNNAPTDAADGPWIIFPERAWAYQQLGMKLPQPSVVVKTWDEVKPKDPSSEY